MGLIFTPTTALTMEDERILAVRDQLEQAAERAGFCPTDYAALPNADIEPLGLLTTIQEACHAYLEQPADTLAADLLVQIGGYTALGREADKRFIQDVSFVLELAGYERSAFRTTMQEMLDGLRRCGELEGDRAFLVHLNDVQARVLAGHLDAKHQAAGLLHALMFPDRSDLT